MNDLLWGKLYNWYAGVDSRGLCPTGWHVPTDSEWNQLILSIDSLSDTSTLYGIQSLTAGGALKSTLNQPIPEGWSASNINVTNSTGFSALPGGVRGFDGSFEMGTSYGSWWTSSFLNDPWVDPISRFMLNGNHPWGGTSISRNTQDRGNFGMSIRCLKD
jgi:uncharacterized protein (TIGR02145 family)